MNVKANFLTFQTQILCNIGQVVSKYYFFVLLKQDSYKYPSVPTSGSQNLTALTDVEPITFIANYNTLLKYKCFHNAQYAMDRKKGIKNYFGQYFVGFHMSFANSFISRYFHDLKKKIFNMGGSGEPYISFLGGAGDEFVPISFLF